MGNLSQDCLKEMPSHESALKPGDEGLPTVLVLFTGEEDDAMDVSFKKPEKIMLVIIKNSK